MFIHIPFCTALGNTVAPLSRPVNTHHPWPVDYYPTVMLQYLGRGVFNARPFVIGVCRNSRKSYHSGDKSKGWSSEGMWAIGAMTFTVPAIFWIYSRHVRGPVHGQELKEVEVENLQQIPRDLGNMERRPLSQNEDKPLVPLIKAKYLLIGGGTASFSAMEEIRRLESDADIMIISEERHAPYLRPPLSKELWFNADLNATRNLRFTDWHGEQKPIFFQNEEFFETKNIGAPHMKTRLVLGKKAVELDVQAKLVTLDDGTVVAYEKVLLATGGQPKMLASIVESPVEVHPHVSTFRTIDDFFRLQDALGPDKHVVVVGGGFLGSELAVALAQYSKSHCNGNLQISQFFPEDGNMSLVFPRYLSRWTMSRVKRAGVKVIPNTRLGSAMWDAAQNKVVLNLDNGTQLKADHVLVAIGIEPNVELALRAGLELDHERGGILTNAELQARSDVFAAGDAISFHDSSLRMRRRVEHYDHSVLSGKLAGANMVDSQHAKPYAVQSMFWSDLGPEVGYEAVGLIDSRLTTVGVWAEATLEDSPRAADLDPSDIRAQAIGAITSRKVDTSEHQVSTVIPSPSGEKTYGKGVVFYVKDRRIVGMVMFNLFNRLSLAKEIIQEERTVEELQTMVELFNINETPQPKV